MTLVVAYLATAVLFLAIDVVALTQFVKAHFERHIGEMMREDPLYGAAGAFYLFYIFGVVWFVVQPALAGDKSLWWVIGNAALLGAIAYGTYEFTNMAVLKGWSWSMVVLDVAWGAVLTAVSAAGGVWITRSVL